MTLSAETTLRNSYVKGLTMVRTPQKCDATSQLLTKQEAYAVADFIDANLIQAIRNDVDIDSMLWLRNLIKAYEKLAKFGGYDAGYADEVEP